MLHQTMTHSQVGLPITSNASAMSFVSGSNQIGGYSRSLEAWRFESLSFSSQAFRLVAPSVRQLRGFSWRRPNGLVCRAMGAAFGSSDVNSSGPVFPRLGVQDPFKRLGVSQDASEEEVREARNYLVEQYNGHEKSREAIESAYDTIIMQSFRVRKASKMDLKSNLRKKVEESPPWVRGIVNMIEVPSKTIMGQRAALFLLLGVWSVFNPANGGPAFQVAISLAACVYFLNDRLKSVARASVLGVSALVLGWVLGSVLMPVIPKQILPKSWSLELSTALVSYIFLWFSCTFLK